MHQTIFLKEIKEKGKGKKLSKKLNLYIYIICKFPNYFSKFLFLDYV